MTATSCDLPTTVTASIVATANIYKLLVSRILTGVSIVVVNRFY